MDAREGKFEGVSHHHHLLLLLNGYNIIFLMFLQTIKMIKFEFADVCPTTRQASWISLHLRRGRVSSFFLPRVATLSFDLKEEDGKEEE